MITNRDDPTVATQRLRSPNIPRSRSSSQQDLNPSIGGSHDAPTADYLHFIPSIDGSYERARSGICTVVPRYLEKVRIALGHHGKHAPAPRCRPR
jgi:hypothetical protein